MRGSFSNASERYFQPNAPPTFNKQVEFVPRRSDALEVTVRGRIIQSDGETLEVAVDASDATGRRWIDDRYKIKTSEAQHMDAHQEPYQRLFNAIANDLAEARDELADDELRNIRSVSELRFAGDFAPDAFQGYLTEDDGEVEIVRLPARDDPMFGLLAEVRGRESMFLATQSGQFERFCAEMARPYTSWRWFAREELVAYKKLRRQALIRKGLAAGDLRPLFERSLSEGRLALEVMVEQASSELGLEPSRVRSYLTENLRFDFGAEEVAGLEEFYRRARDYGLVDSEVSPPIPSLEAI